MSNRFATRIGLPSAEERPADAFDLVAFHEPSVGALARTKGSLFLLAQLTGGNASLAKASREALDAIQRDYYYDLSAGVLVSLAKALSGANRRLYHARKRLGIPRRSGVSVVAVVVRGREAHAAKLGPASAVIVRDARMYEIPPPPAVTEEDPRVRRRRVAASLGEALEVEPYTWQGALAADDRIALVSRHFAHTVGVDELKQALATMRPAQAIEHLQHVFAIRGGTGSDGILAVEVDELPATATTHHLEPVRPAEPFAGLPDQSPVPLADAIGRGLHRAGDAAEAAKSAFGRSVVTLMTWILAFVPRRRPEYPRSIPRTAEREQGRRRRRGMAGMVGVAAVMAFGSMVAALPAVRPTDAIPRAAVARESIGEAVDLVSTVERRVDGADLVDRDPAQASELLAGAHAAVERATAAGVAGVDLAPLRARIDRRLDALYLVARADAIATVVDLGAALDDVDAADMVAASDGSLWVLDAGRGRIIRADPADGSVAVIYRAGQALESGEVPGDPWLIATAATDVVVIDRQRSAWRIDLAERVPRRMPLAGAEGISAETTLVGALQHRPPLEIFTLYVVDGATGRIDRWSPPAVIPVTYPDPAEPFLTEAPDLDPRDARDLRVDVNAWLLYADTVTRVDFGSPRDQTDYSLDPPPDVDVRPVLDYRLLDGATVGDRDFLYVYDAANDRIIAFQRADGAFVRQWMAPAGGESAGGLADVRGLSVASVSDGPPVAYLLTADGVVRLVLE
jgi:serine/threonine protein phosphatase PrpC